MNIALVTNVHPSKHMGGAQYQTWLLAKGLMERGHTATFLAIRAEKGDAFVDDDGLPVVEIPGWRKVSADQYEALIKRAIEDTNADLAYVRYFAGLSFLAKVCRASGIPYVSLSVHSEETSPFLAGYNARGMISNLVSRAAWMHWQSFRAIRHSAVHVCNLRDLQTKVGKWYPSKRIETIYNGSPVPAIDESSKQPSGQVIWVNNMKRWKRPELYIELARRLPDFRFVMVGRLPSGPYGDEMTQRLEDAPPNLVYVGYQPVEEANRLISESDLLLYTSLPVEGFANSFLQAWFRRVPTVSYEFELDGVLEREAIGRCAKDFEELVETVDELMRDHPKRIEMGESARSFAVRQFNVDRMVDEYAALFDEILA